MFVASNLFDLMYCILKSLEGLMTLEASASKVLEVDWYIIERTNI